MDMHQLINHLHAQKLRVWVSEQDTLALGYEDNVAPTLLTTLKTHKADILALLSAHNIRSEAAFLKWPAIKPMQLSNTQARLLFVDNLDSQRCAYHIPLLVKLNEGVNKEDITNNVDQVVAKHPLLNSYIIEDARGLSCQTQLNPLSYSSRRVTSTAELKSQVYEAIHTPFTLSHEAPFKVCFYQLNNDTYCLFLWHHIVFDAWSMRVFFDELAGQCTIQTPATTSYFDYVRWQSKQNFATAHQYWQQQLSGAHPTQIQATQYQQVGSSQAQNHYFSLCRTQSNAVKQLAKQFNTTPYVILLSQFVYQIAQYSGESDIVIGAPTDNRDHPQTQDIIGCLVNTLLLRVNTSNHANFSELIQQTANTLKSAKQHQHLPFDEQLQYLDGATNSALPSLMFSLQRFGSDLVDEFNLPFKRADEFNNDELYNPVKCDLRLAFDDSQEELQGQLNYDPSKFDLDFIVHFANTYQITLAKAIENPERSLNLGHVNALPSFECMHQEVAQHRSLYQNFKHVALTHSSDVALRYQQQSISYSSLLGQVEHLAKHLKHHMEQQASSTVALMYERSPEMIIALLAVLAAGGHYVPLNPTQGSHRNEFILNDCGAKILLHSISVKTSLSELNFSHTAITIDELSETRTPDIELGTRQHDQLAYAIYTSGSTGSPKGVLVEDRQVLALIESTTSYYQFDNTEHVCALPPYYFDAFVEPLFLALLNGATFIVPTEQEVNSPEKINALLSDDVTHLVASPAILNALTRPQKSQLKRVITGGEACNRQLLETWKPLLFIEYGPTEATVTSSIYATKTNVQTPANIGKPLEHCAFIIVDEQLNALPDYCPGEILISGHGISRGYLNLESQNRSRFIELNGTHYYRTGDIARRLANGDYQYLGRNDRQVKLRGLRIELTEIENALLMHPGINQACVKVQNSAQGDALVAYLCGETVSVRAINSTLKTYLPEYMHPSAISWLPALPLTANGKVNLAALEPIEISSSEQYRPPRNHLEQALCKLWQTELNLPQVGIDDDYFMLGGNSVSAMSLVAKMQHQHGIVIELKQFLAARTIAKINHQDLAKDTISVVNAPLVEQGLTHQQTALLVNEQLSPNAAAYHIPLFLECDTVHKQQALLNAIQDFIAHYPILRTTYKQDTTGQWCYHRTLEDIHLENLSLDELSQFTQRRFELTHQAPLRIALINSPTTSNYAIYMVFHHIAFDGWSTRVLLQSLDAILNGQSHTPAPVQFKEYAAWQSQRSEQDLDFWQTRFAGLSLAPWETDTPRQAVNDHIGESIDFTFADDLTHKLRAFAKAQNTSLYTVLLTAYQLSLCLWSQREHVVVGSPSDNRPSECRQAVGYFVNTLPHILQKQDSQSFCTHIKNNQSYLIEAKAHESVSLDKLSNAVEPTRAAGVTPLFQTFFSLDQFNISEQQSPHFEVAKRSTQVGGEYTPAKFDWNLICRDDGTTLLAQFIFMASYYESDRCQQFLDFFTVYINNLCDYSEQPICDVPMISQREFKSLMPNTDITPPSFLAQFSAAVQSHSDKVALRYQDTEITYAQLDKVSDHIAHQLSTCTPSIVSNIALYFEKGAVAPVIMLSALKAGIPFVSLSTNHPVTRNLEILTLAQTDLIVCEHAAPDWYKGQSLVIDLDKLLLKHTLDDFEPLTYPQDKLAYLIFTSGTTGKPKGAMLHHGGLANLCQHMRHSHQLENAEQVIASQFAEYVFDASICEIFPALAAGAQLEVVPETMRKDPTALCQFLVERQVKVAFLPTVLINQFADKIAQIQLQLLFTGGSKLNPVDIKLAETFLNEYGLSETSVCVTQAQVICNQPIKIGHAISNTQTFILDAEKNILPKGAIGELYVGGQPIGLGYWQNPQQTAKHFDQHAFAHGHQQITSYLYRTGDLVRLDKHNGLEFIARADQQWDIDGHRIEPAEIECKLLKHPDVKQAAAHLIKTHAGANSLVAYIVTDHADTSSIQHWFNAQVPHYMQLTHVTAMATLPLTLNGKLDTSKLPTVIIEHNTDIQAPETETEKALAPLWSEYLGVANTDLNQHFFALGGSSIVAAKLVSQYSTQLNMDIPLSLLLTHPTFKAFAQAIAERQQQSQISDDEFEMEI
ncbi:amino acid adenylation domain-containing protein [Pseudoalteromonas luteoviolacea]|uniref:non-ribosomal peptide synthetase n=1 Tax=Pseudoalteromonas luteoviolacea TaxID=43657 RepID=UPI001B3A232E|nr:non-ribosomal peptide synthetase [Pseudoalteromonas luteoviolacea]MBQ4879517.1 amino acid adenylation domain-containing protein [Pseudoalteromonas luteoviolacea]MBQ4908556.1 amino acid adenylation domain-containing protein [Pseudoalteromonas luteoviolacea]